MKMKKLTALLLSAIMAISSVSVTAVAEGTQVEVGGQSEAASQGSTWQDVDLTPTGGIIQPQSIEVSEDDIPEGVKEYTIADYAASVAEDGIALFSANSSTERYDSGYGLAHLREMDNADGAIALYEVFDKMAEDFETENKNYTPKRKNSTVEFAKTNFYQYGLTYDEACSVFAIWTYDNPQLYWLMNGISYYTDSFGEKTGDIALSVQYEYLSSKARQECDDIIKEKAAEFKTAADKYSTNYDKAMAVHDILTTENVYDYDSNGSASYSTTAHNVMGALDENRNAVCESFAKAYSLAMNYIGIDCIYAISDDHAWNYVQMDDGNYYGVDVTWDADQKCTNGYYRSEDSYSYFALGAGFNLSHKAHTPDGVGYSYLYELPTIPESDYKSTFETGTIEKDGFKYSYTGHILTLTDATSATGDVTLPSEIDGKYLRVIAAGAFAKSGITSITIPDSVVRINNSGSGYYVIDKGAFANCKNLTKVTLSKNMRYIGELAFINCPNLTEVYVPYKVSSYKYATVIGAYALGYDTDSNNNFVKNNLTIKGKVAQTPSRYVGAQTYANSNGFTFVPDTQDIDDCDIMIYQDDISYVGTYAQISPFVVVKDGDKYLEEYLDYTLTYGTNQAIGSGTVTITGAGNYTGSHTFTFTIGNCNHQNYTITHTKYSCNEGGGTDTYKCSVCNTIIKTVSTAQTDHCYDSHGQCIYCRKIKNGVGIIRQANVTLSDSISVNFVAELSTDVASYKYVEMIFEVDGETIIAKGTRNVQGYIVFSCPINAKQMDSVISATLSYEDQTSDTYTYSMKKYVDKIRDLAKNNSGYEKALDLVNATYAYGCYAQRYFDNNSSSTIDDDVALTIANINLSALADKNVYKNETKKITGLKFHGDSLLLEAKTVERFYFELEEGYDINDYTFMCNNVILTPGTKNGRYYVDVEGIAPNQLGDKQVVTVTRGDETLTVENSPLSYVYLMRNHKPNTDFPNLMKALVNYYNAATAYLAKSAAA